MPLKRAQKVAGTVPATWEWRKAGSPYQRAWVTAVAHVGIGRLYDFGYLSLCACRNDALGSKDPEAMPYWTKYMERLVIEKTIARLKS